MKNYNVFECVNITNVINQLHIKKINQIGYNIYAVCPFCQSSNEKKGYLKINTLKNVYVCKQCESSGSSIDLYANVNFITTKAAYKMLLRKKPILDNISYTYNNPIKDEYYRDLVYRSFLEKLQLNDFHCKKLKDMKFTDEYIRDNLFKSIEVNNNKKKLICMELQKEGFKLEGIPGFFQDTDFKWNYKSHKGIFIPVVLDGKIQGLRILLDEKYDLDTKNIWFSSNNEYNGTKATNWAMVLKDKNINWIDTYNSNNKKSIIIATEMILAHKLFNNTNKIVIGIPNNIDKDWILNITKKMNVSEVFLYADQYTLLHTSTLMYKNIIKALEDNNIKVDFRVALTENDIGSDLKQQNNKKIA